MLAARTIFKARVFWNYWDFAVHREKGNLVSLHPPPEFECYALNQSLYTDLRRRESYEEKKSGRTVSARTGLANRKARKWKHYIMFSVCTNTTTSSQPLLLGWKHKVGGRRSLMVKISRADTSIFITAAPNEKHVTKVKANKISLWGKSNKSMVPKTTCLGDTTCIVYLISFDTLGSRIHASFCR